MNLLIGFDIGTSSMKAAAVSADGVLISDAKLVTKLEYPAKNHIEFSAEKHFDDFLKLLKQLISKLPENSTVKALAIGGAGGASLVLDDKNNPLINIISWMDSRAKTENPALMKELDPAEVHKITGWPFDNYFPLGHFAWLKSKLPDIHKKAARFCLNIDYLNYKVSGKWAIDESSATPSFLYDQKNHCWHKPYLQLAGIHQPEALSKLYKPGAIIGTISEKFASLSGLDKNCQLVAGAFDHPCAAIGSGTFKEGSLLISAGTSWVGFSPVHDRNNAINNKLLADPFMESYGANWGAIFSIPMIGTAIDECVNKNYELYAGSHSVDKYQLFTEMAKTPNDTASCSFIDLRKPAKSPPPTSDGSFCRNVMNSASYMLKREIEKFSSYGFPIRKISMVGGPSQNIFWAQIISDICGVPLRLSGGQAAGAIGAAILAGKGAETFASVQDGFSRLKLASETLTPSLDKHKIYDRFYQDILKKGAMD